MAAVRLPLPDYKRGVLTCTVCLWKVTTSAPESRWREHLGVCRG